MVTVNQLASKTYDCSSNVVLSSKIVHTSMLQDWKIWSIALIVVKPPSLKPHVSHIRTVCESQLKHMHAFRD